MSIKRQIAEIEGVQDPVVSQRLKEIKGVIEAATGRLPNRPGIKQLGTNATLGGVITKVNEIIKRLQEE